MFCLINRTILQIDVYLTEIGLISCIFIIGLIITKLYTTVRAFVLPRLFPPDLTFYGEWAVVTGGCSGIGKSYACHLAHCGMNIVIISNKLDALKLATREIRSEYGVQCSYVCVDFTEGLGIYKQVMDQLEDKDIGILLNAAGIIGGAPCYFTEELERNVLAMIDLHIGAVISMTMRILPLMLAKKKGVIINVSSITSLFPTVLFSVYSSCKAFSDRFIRALHWEYSKRNGNCVTFQSVNPSLVYTNLSKGLSLPSVIKILAANSDDFAASATKTISLKSHTSGYFPHEIIWFFAKYIPSIINKIFLLGYHRFVCKHHRY